MGDRFNDKVSTKSTSFKMYYMLDAAFVWFGLHNDSYVIRSVPICSLYEPLIRLLCFYLGYYTTIRLVGLSGHFLDYRNEITYHHCFREGIGSD